MTAERPIERPIGRPGPSWGGSAVTRTTLATELAQAAEPLQPCSFRRRIASFAIDQGIAWLTVFIVLGVVLSIAGVDPDAPEGSRDARLGEALTILALGALLGYFWIWNSVGFSPGKQMLGLRIVNEQGEPPGVARGFARTIASLLVPLSVGGGYVWAAWDRSTTLPLARGRRQTWHDKVSGTYVVRA